MSWKVTKRNDKTAQMLISTVHSEISKKLKECDILKVCKEEGI